jgi:hypothetical protein
VAWNSDDQRLEIIFYESNGIVDIGAGNVILISRVIAVADATQSQMQEVVLEI